MKRILLFVFPAVIAFGCQDRARPNVCGLELKLVKMTSSWTGDVDAGNDLAWEETIVLRNDSSFLKRRVQAGAVAEAAGHYTYVDQEDRHYVELTYDHPESDLRSSCSSTEFIGIKSSTLFQNTEWPACDGSTLEYEAHPAPCGK
jgi:hypothetical protein